jgi:hypothetical protein
MPDDEIITLETGEQARVDQDGTQYLIPGPDPELVDAEATRAEKDLRVAALKQAQRDAIAAKKDAQAADPAVPAEKRIY